MKQTSAEINGDLSNYFTEIQNIFKEFEVKDEMPTTVQLREAFNLAIKKKLNRKKILFKKTAPP